MACIIMCPEGEALTPLMVSSFKYKNPLVLHAIGVPAARVLLPKGIAKGSWHVA